MELIFVILEIKPRGRVSFVSAALLCSCVCPLFCIGVLGLHMLFIWLLLVSGIKFRWSSLHNKHIYLLIHLPGPAITVFWQREKTFEFVWVSISQLVKWSSWIPLFLKLSWFSQYIICERMRLYTITSSMTNLKLGKSPGSRAVKPSAHLKKKSQTH